MKIVDKMKQIELFTKTETKVIDYILQTSDQLKNMSINTLAMNSFSSNATIIRICHKLGFEGYRDFKIGLLTELESQKFITNKIDYSIPFHSEESTEDIVNSIYSLYKVGISEIQTQLDVRELEQIADCLTKAKRIFIFAIGDAKITAMGFMNKMLKINYFPILATENGEEYAIVQKMDPQDCAMFITYSASREKYEEHFRDLKKKGVPTIVLTANEQSLLTKYASYHLCLPDLESREKIATFYSQFGFTYYLSLIYSLIYNKNSK